MNQHRVQFFSAMNPSERRSVAVVALIAMLRMFGLFALLPVLALHAGTLEHATPVLIGLAVGGYGLTQAALQIPFGSLSDRVGRIPVILAGLAIFAAGSLLAGHTDSIYGVIAGRLLQGAGAVSATLAALLSDATREDIRTRSMAVLGIGIGSSFLLALVFGPLLASLYGVRFLFWLAAALALLAAAMLLGLPEDIEQPVARPGRRIRDALLPELLKLDLYVFILHAVLTASFVALPFVLRDSIGIDPTDHWKLYVTALLASLAGTIPLVIADDSQGKASTVTIALVLLGLGQLWLYLSGAAYWWVIAGLAVFFAGFNFLEAGLPARLSKAVAGDLRGASLGVFSSCQFLGAFAGGLLGGALLSAGGSGAVFLGCTALAGFWLVLDAISRKH